MRTLSKKQKVIIAGVVLLGLSGTGVAYGYWSTSGSGTGTAATGVGAPSLVVTQTAAPSNLAPGVAPGGITVTVKNTAANSAKVNQVVASIASVTQAAGVVGTCDATDYTLTSPTMINGAQDLASGATATFTGATLAFNDKATTNQDGCKGATVNLSYAVS